MCAIANSQFSTWLELCRLLVTQTFPDNTGQKLKIIGTQYEQSEDRLPRIKGKVNRFDKSYIVDVETLKKYFALQVQKKSNCAKIAPLNIIPFIIAYTPNEMPFPLHYARFLHFPMSASS